ncbi:hypothetical protein VTL71DRAFT_1720 [Oculimacula yallundae]|uniref:Uncharacterized protein n=1 Tax=Oculimacula yallundae TaxID=86028 RepID=A0ABR4CCV2_9HELO
MRQAFKSQFPSRRGKRKQVGADITTDETSPGPLVVAGEAEAAGVELPVADSASLPEALYSTAGNYGMKIVAQPTAGVFVDLDIVFVHGLTGNRITTWTHKNKTFWPKELANDITTARIMTFGYDADVLALFGMAGSNNLSDNGKGLAFAISDIHRACRDRPIILIAHSLGGLLRRTNITILDPLKPASEVLQATQQAFQSLVPTLGRQISIHCFYEEKPGFGTGFIVDKHSAVLAQYPNSGINSNHVDMTKFTGRDDDNYQKVLGRLWHCMELLSAAEDGSEPHPDKQGTLGAILSPRTQTNNFSGSGPSFGNVGTMGDFNYHAGEDVMDKCLPLLRGSSEYKQDKDRNPIHTEGTCQWVLGHESFKKWQRCMNSAILLITANAGCGKSVLSRFLVDQELQGTEKRITCYFFFKDDRLERRSATRALCVLLHQIATQNISLRKHIVQSYKENGDVMFESMEVLWSTLLSISQDPHAGEIICILDALDECQEDDLDSLLRTLCQFYEISYANSHARLKFLLTSRSYDFVETYFRKLRLIHPEVHLKGEDETGQIEKEIVIAIQASVEDLQAYLQLDTNDVLSLERHFTKMTHWTYLWLSLVIRMIRYSKDLELRTEAGREALFSTMPTSVDDAYTAMLDKVEDKPRAWKLLKIVCAATQPLSPQELYIALRISGNDTTYDRLHKPSATFCETFIRDACGLFVTIMDHKIYLLHQTAKEFLMTTDPTPRLDIDDDFDGAWNGFISIRNSHSVLAYSCMRYLCLQDLFENQTLYNEVENEYSIYGEACEQQYLDVPSPGGDHPPLGMEKEAAYTYAAEKRRELRETTDRNIYLL